MQHPFLLELTMMVCRWELFQLQHSSHFYLWYSTMSQEIPFLTHSAVKSKKYLFTFPPNSVLYLFWYANSSDLARGNSFKGFKVPALCLYIFISEHLITFWYNKLFEVVPTLFQPWFLLARNGLRDWALDFHCYWGVFAFSRVKKLYVHMYLYLYIDLNIHICTNIYISIDIFVRNHKFLLIKATSYIHVFNLSLIPHDMPFFYSENHSSQELMPLCFYSLAQRCNTPNGVYHNKQT